MGIRLGPVVGPEVGPLLGPNFGPADAAEALEQVLAAYSLTFDQVLAGTNEALGGTPHTFTVQTGALVEQTPTAGLKANDISNQQIEIPDASATAALDATDNTIGDPGTSTLYIMVVYLPTTNPGATLTHFGKRRKSGDFGGLEVTSATNGRPTARIDVGSGSGVTAACVTDHYDGAWHTVVVCVDQNAGQIRIASDLDAQASTAFTSASETNTEVFSLGEHRLDSAEGNYALLAIAQGAQVEGLDCKAIADDVQAAMVT